MIEFRYKRQPETHLWSCGETVSQQTFNLHVLGSNPSGTT